MGMSTYRSDIGTYCWGIGTYHLRVGTYRLGIGTYHLGIGAYHSGKGAYHLGIGTYCWGIGTYRSGYGYLSFGAVMPSAPNRSFAATVLSPELNPHIHRTTTTTLREARTSLANVNQLSAGGETGQPFAKAGVVLFEGQPGGLMVGYRTRVGRMRAVGVEPWEAVTGPRRRTGTGRREHGRKPARK